MESQRSINSNNDRKDITKLSVLTILILLLLALLGTSCREDDCPNQMIQHYEPVYKSLDEIRASASFEAAREIENPGKIYYKDGYIFINEVDSGIHVIDNRDLSNPISVGFLNLPGTKDLAARGDYMYVDSYMDLVVLDISNKGDIVESGRVKDVFDNYYYYYDGLGVLVDYVITEEEVEIDCENDVFIDRWGDWAFAEGDFLASTTNKSSGGNTTGIGGSLARFTITDDYLYTNAIKISHYTSL